MPLTRVFVTLRACPRALRTLKLGQNTRIWQSASQENARRESRAQANFPCAIKWPSANTNFGRARTSVEFCLVIFVIITGAERVCR
jgi:hypothetical protein